MTFLDQSIRLNIAAAVLDRLRGRFGFLRARPGSALASRTAADLNLSTADLERPVQSLSGGNQQRVLLARWLTIEPRILVLHGPTVGVDVGSKETLYRLIQRLTQVGLAIILISDDLSELLQNTDRILVMKKGTVSDEIATNGLSEGDLYRALVSESSTAANAMSGAPAVTPVIASTQHVALFRGRPELFPAALIGIVCLIVGAINSSFFQVSTLFDLLRSCTVMGLFALGVLIVLASGGIDISFTAIAALTTYSLTKVFLHFWPEAPFVIIFLAGGVGGALLGSLNGFLIHTLKAPSLIVTIGTQYLFRGILLTFVGTAFVMDIPKSMDGFGQQVLLQHLTENDSRTVLPLSVLVMVVAATLTNYMLNRTLMGRAIYALGGNLSIAERLGYPLRKIHIFVFGFAGFLAGIAGIVHVSSTRIANPFDLVGTELEVIAAVVLGGARITGGTGTVTGTLLGVVLVVLINNVLILAGVPSTWQKLILGAFILFAGGLAAVKRAP